MQPPPQPHNTVGSIVARQMKHHGMNVADLENFKPLVSNDKALEDVLPGYHGRRSASTAQTTGMQGARGSRVTSSSSKKKKATIKSVKFQQIGSLLFLLCGMWVEQNKYGKDQVVLRNTKTPTGPEEEELRQEGVQLLVDEDADGNLLQFSPEWSMLAIDKWLRSLAPLLFQYLDLTYGVRDGTDDQYHWRLARQQHKQAFLFGKELVNGNDLSKCLGGQARKKETFRLHIATRQPVDKAIWTDFARAIRVAQKKPASSNIVDVINRKPATQDEYDSDESNDEADSSEDDDDSDPYVDVKAGKAGDLDAAMEEVNESSDEDPYALLTKPALGDKRRASNPLQTPDPLLSPIHLGAAPTSGIDPAQPTERLNANGKRRATSPPSPPGYNTRLAKRARRALIESPEREGEREVEAMPAPEQAETAHKPEQSAGAADGVDAGDATTLTQALFNDGFDFDAPLSPGDVGYYYSPAPPSPPLNPIDTFVASTSRIDIPTEPRPVLLRESPGRPSKSAWKKRNPS